MRIWHILHWPIIIVLGAGPPAPYFIMAFMDGTMDGSRGLLNSAAVMTIVGIVLMVGYIRIAQAILGKIDRDEDEEAS